MSDIKQSQAPFDNYGLQHGEWIGYYDNGKLAYRFNYVHGTAHGVCKGYNDNGKLTYHRNYNMGREIGYWYDYGKIQYYLCLI